MAEWGAPGGLKEKVPFGQLPAITLPGSPDRFIAQSGSCSRYVAKICGLCPILLAFSTGNTKENCGIYLWSANL